MPRLFIPEIGTKLVLTDTWYFLLYSERRNVDFFVHFTGVSKEDFRKRSWRNCPEPAVVAVPRKSILVIDRIYIRQGNEEYSSVTFRMPVTEDHRSFYRMAEDKKLPKSVRFWAKLSDVNEIQYERLP